MTSIAHRPPPVPSKNNSSNGGGQRQQQQGKPGLKRRHEETNNDDSNTQDGSQQDQTENDQYDNNNDGGGNNGSNMNDELPVDIPIQRNGGGAGKRQNNNNNNNNKQRNNNGGGGVNGYRNMNDGGSDQNVVAPVVEEPLPSDPVEAKKVLDRRESIRKTEVLRKLLQPKIDDKIDFSKRQDESIKLANINPELAGLKDVAKKSKTPGQAMYFVDHTYKGAIGPTIQVIGRLLGTPMMGVTYESINYTIEILNIVEQQNLSALSRNFKKNFTRLAVEKQWPFAGVMINKMVYHDFYIRGKIMDEDLRAKYLDPDLLPADLIDVNPETKQRKPIEFYPPKLKCQLLMSKKVRNKVETDVMDENENRLNPFDFRKGNLVCMSVGLRYAYYKAQPGSITPNEYGVPCKLLLIKRLDQHEDVDGGPAKRTKFAAEDIKEQTPSTATPSTSTSSTPSTSPPAVVTNPIVVVNTPVQTQPPTPPQPHPMTQELTPEQTSEQLLGSAAVAALKAQSNLPLPTPKEKSTETKKLPTDKDKSKKT